MMNAAIVLMDMHIRDERVFKFICERAEHTGGIAKLTHEQIADHFGCHRNTAAAIIRRLELARFLEIEKYGKRGGYIYRPVKDAENPRN